MFARYNAFTETAEMKHVSDEATADLEIPRKQPIQV